MSTPKKFLLTFLAVASVATVFVLFGAQKCPANMHNSGLKFSFNYKLNVDNIPDGSKAVEVWIPLPTNNDSQELIDYRISSELPYELYVDPEYGNRVVHLASNGQIPENLKVEIILNVTRIEQDGWNQKPEITSIDKREFKRYLMPDILVPIDGPIEAEAKQVVNGSKTPSEKMKALYDHLFESMKYDKSGVGWGNGDALYACESRQGNCTDIHSLFIGMARSQGIPSRFIMGFPLPDNETKAEIPGYHCWAEFYIEGHGWVPVDISEAIKNPEKKDYFFGRLDAHRVAFTTGRDIKVNFGKTSHTLNYFIYPYVVVDGQPIDGTSYSFSFEQMN